MANSKLEAFFGQGIFRYKFLIDIIKTFVGVLLAFLFNNWVSEREMKAKERFLYDEIQHELELNLSDLRINLFGHEEGMNATKKFLQYLQSDTVNTDSLPLYYQKLLRGFVSIQHTAAYETLKSRGMEAILNDSLRLQIADLYDFEFETVEKLEEQYQPHEFFGHYHQHMTPILTKYYDFSKPLGQKRQIMPFSKLPLHERSLLSAWLKNMFNDRYFMIVTYQNAIAKGEKVAENIKKVSK